MALRVLVTRRLAIDPRAQLGPDLELDLHDAETAMPRELLLTRIQTAHGLLSTLADQVDRALLEQAPLLRVVANHAVGIDNIDLAECTARGIQVTHTPDVLTEATADLAFALLLAVARRLREGERLVREGRYRGWAPTMLLGRELRGATLGIHGFGRIGQAMARRAAAFGMRVLCHSRTAGRGSVRTASAGLGAAADGLGAAGPQVTQVSFAELLQQADFLSIHCPLTPQTLRAYSTAQFAQMKRGAILINTARGPIVDEAALLAALQSGQLGGAGLDVFEREPQVHPGLLVRDDVVLLPHLGSATQETRAQMASLALVDLGRVLRGEAPLHPVNQLH